MENDNDFYLNYRYLDLEERNIPPLIPARNAPVAAHPKYDAVPYANVGLGLMNVVCENLLFIPCTVIRRQCQVHVRSIKYHTTPFTLIPVMVNLQRRQGLGTLWKGTGSTLIVKGLGILSEDAFNKATHWPKQLPPGSWIFSFRKTVQHLLLKAVTFVVVLPFHCASLVETVQSDIASEKPGVFDCLREGLRRLLSNKVTKTSRELPLWTLAIPSVVVGILRYIIGASAQFVVLSLSQQDAPKNSEQATSTVAVQEENLTVQLTASFFSQLAADVIMYPAETVLHRLYIQGTRTIVDNLDTGCEVIPIITSYSGAMDCFQSIVAEEGSAGLYKGFGALILQYAIYAGILRLVTCIVNEWKKSKCIVSKQEN